MLKLRDFLHLPQLDALVDQLVAEESGLIVLAGINARQVQLPDDQPVEKFTPSGLSALFNILLQEILLAHPLVNAVVVAEERSLARVPRQISRRVRLLQVDSDTSFQQQVEIAAKQRPGLLVIERLDAESAPAVFRAAEMGLRVLVQFDTVLRGAAVARHFLEMGVQREQLSALRWVLTNQRMSLLCRNCRQMAGEVTDHFTRLRGRYPHISETIDGFLNPPTQFYRAGSCDQCHGTGYQGDIAVFDIFRNDPASMDFFSQSSLLSLEEYALRLAGQGELDLDDLLNLENDHLRRTYQMLTTSERALRQSNSALNRKLFELEASNRVLVQRTEVLMSLQDLGQALITSTNLHELAARICRRAGEVCGADRVVLYLWRTEDSGAEQAEILAVRGWDSSAVGLRLAQHHVYDAQGREKSARYMKIPVGVRPPTGKESDEENRIRMGLRVPLLAQEKQVGVMVVQSTQKDYFTPGETALLQTFANQAALGIQRAGLVDELRAKIVQLEAAQAELVKKERLDRELELARQVQQSMLPHSFPEVAGFAVSARNEPARQVGGDFYDVILLDADHFGVVIADVADKGMPAALYMALTRSLLLAEARRALSPREVLFNVNHLLLELGEMGGGFVSIFYGVINRTTRQIRYARAGHERPLLLRDGKSGYLPGDGVVLGILEEDDMHLSEEQIDLLPGDRLILYTDGLSDVADMNGQFSGHALLEKMLQARAHQPADEICSAIFADLAGYRGLAEQFDDMTVLVVEVK